MIGNAALTIICSNVTNDLLPLSEVQRGTKCHTYKNKQKYRNKQKYKNRRKLERRNEK
jgi:hypothetical protein